MEGGAGGTVTPCGIRARAATGATGVPCPTGVTGVPCPTGVDGPAPARR
ncbi:hypothetical protein GCM10010267_30890 [Streptomyces griseorubens]|nr:hypothetical protein GCM10010267_30890 [Streptomyces griseorubens]